MKILEYGNKENKKIILIHGFQCPYQIWEDYIKYYEKKFHIIVPILPGHIPNKEDFISFDECSKKIEDYYISKYGNDVYAIYGMSMGGIVASKIWQNKKLNIEKLIIESAPLTSYNKFINFVITKQYLNLTHKAQKRNKFVLNMAVKTVIPKDKLNNFLEILDNMSDTNIINYTKAIGNYKLLKNINSNTKIYYFHGTKINELFAKKSAKYIKSNYPDSVIICFKGRGHCENFLMNTEVMIKELDKILIG